jgi:hypothetical protein
MLENRHVLLGGAMIHKLVGLFAATLLVCGSVHASVLPNARETEQKRIETYRGKLLNHNRWNTVIGNDDPHVIFNTPQDAIDWMKQVAPRLKSSMGAKKFDVVELSDPRYAVLQSYVHDLWVGYRELFPTQTANLNEPPVVLVDTEVSNAFVTKHVLQKDKIAHAIVVLSALVDEAGGVDKRDFMTGIFAHELAHSVFRHLLPEYEARVDKFYDADKARIGFTATRNSQLDRVMGAWVQSAQLVGDLTNSELQMLPSNGLGKPIFLKLWVAIKATLDEENAVCKAAHQSLLGWLKLQPISTFETAYSIADLGAVNAASNQVVTQSKQCYQGKKASFIELFAKVLGTTSDQLKGIPEVQEMAAQFDAAADPVQGLQNLVTPLRAAMIKVEKALPLAKVGNFTAEEHADDVSLIVHRYINRDPMSLANFFRSAMPKADLSKCDSILQAGGLPPTGAFSDGHRALCYRVIHLVDLNKFIDASGKDVKAFAATYIQQTTGAANSGGLAIQPAPLLNSVRQ